MNSQEHCTVDRKRSCPLTLSLSGYSFGVTENTGSVPCITTQDTTLCVGLGQGGWCKVSNLRSVLRVDVISLPLNQRWKTPS